MTNSERPQGTLVKDRFEAALYLLARIVAIPAASALWGFRLYGWHRMPEAGAVVLASNHQSFLDPFFLGGSAPRCMRFLARDTLFRRPVGWLIRGLGAIPVVRDSADLAAMREAVGALKAGEPLLLFPEGTRTRDGRIASFRPGISMLARRGAAVVVPCVIRGAFEAWPRHQPLPAPFRPVRVHYGPAVVPAEGESPRELAERVERAVRELWVATERPGGSSA